AQITFCNYLAHFDISLKLLIPGTTLEYSEEGSKNGYNNSFHSADLTTATTKMSTDSICTRFLVGTANNR
ncbi:MAG: hypothetical protein KAI17_12015, partial [Thiotrichaceae bacterium]|nr:hypothetical protein [Thiotrichaceae bacterium]